MNVLWSCAILCSGIDIVLGQLVFIFSLPGIVYFCTEFNDHEREDVALFGIIFIPTVALLYLLGGAKTFYSLLKRSRTDWTFYWLKLIFFIMAEFIAFIFVPMFIFVHYNIQVEFLINLQSHMSIFAIFEESNSKSTTNIQEPPSHPAFGEIRIVGNRNEIDILMRRNQETVYRPFYMLRLLTINILTVIFMIYQILSTILVSFRIQQTKKRENENKKMLKKEETRIYHLDSTSADMKSNSEDENEIQ